MIMDAKATKQIISIDNQLAKLEPKLIALKQKRRDIMESQKTWTAKDYRIVLIEDESVWDFDDIMGDAPTEEDSQGFKDRYQAMYDAYYGDDRYGHSPGIFALIVDVQKRDVETGEFESVESCGGLFHLDSDSQKQIFAEARDIASDVIDLPKGVSINDIDVLSEEDAK